MKDLDLMLKLMLQLGIILISCRFIGWVGKRFLGQTQVVMEMLAGVLLGPSLFGALAITLQSWLTMSGYNPVNIQTWLFPKELIVAGQTVEHPSMSILYCLSQLGLVLYMFLIGLEFDPKILMQSAKSALGVSTAGIVAPFLLGGLLGLKLAGSATFFGPSVTPLTSALYLGAAMCITAFPMLARIIHEQGISKAKLGVLALASGASNDVFAWIMLAIVIAVNKENVRYAVFAIGGGSLFALFLLTIGKSALKSLGRKVEQEGHVSNSVFLTTLILLMASSFYTDFIGVYAVFGAFILGVAMPRGLYADLVRKQLEQPVTTLLLPLFFVFSGLNTRIGLVNTPYLWMITLLVCAAAILGKGIACALAAKASGEGWRESWAIGSLMNARGLMELILVNIAKDAKVITPTLFTILVIMAVVTTLMASPLYRWISGSMATAGEISGSTLPA